MYGLAAALEALETLLVTRSSTSRVEVARGETCLRRSARGRGARHFRPAWPCCSSGRRPARARHVTPRRPRGENGRTGRLLSLYTSSRSSWHRLPAGVLSDRWGRAASSAGPGPRGRLRDPRLSRGDPRLSRSPPSSTARDRGGGFPGPLGLTVDRSPVLAGCGTGGILHRDDLAIAWARVFRVVYEEAGFRALNLAAARRDRSVLVVFAAGLRRERA